MDFDLSPRLIAARERALRFAAAELLVTRDGASFDRQAWSRLAAFGLFAPLGALERFNLLEALGQGGIGRGLLFAAGAHLFGCLTPIASEGTPEHQSKWCGALRDGSLIGALAMTEPGGGSAIDRLTTTATETENGYLLRGEKTLICNAPHAGLFLTFANQFPERGGLGLTAFLIPAETKGVRVAAFENAAALKGAALGTVAFEDCKLPRDAVLGRPGAGLKIFAAAMQWERSCLLAGMLGAAQRDLRLVARALTIRRDAAGPLTQHQAVSHALARIKLALDNAYLAGSRAAWLVDQGRSEPATAAAAKLTLSEAVLEAAQEGLRLMAGRGWLGTPVDFAGALLDAQAGLIASGTSEIQLEIVARDLISGSARG